MLGYQRWEGLPGLKKGPVISGAGFAEPKGMEIQDSNSQSAVTENHYLQLCVCMCIHKNPLEEMKQSSQSTKESEMQYLDAISKMTE